MLHYGLQYTFDDETARARLQKATLKHIKPGTVSIETEMEVPPRLRTLESQLTAL